MRERECAGRTHGVAAAGPAWEKFRSSKIAGHVGLATPRFLLRQPYGAKTNACEVIPFEEMGEENDPQRLLWGNPAILCACLLAASFERRGLVYETGQALQSSIACPYMCIRKTERLTCSLALKSL